MSPDRLAADESLRQRGLPMFVPVRRWHDGLIVRTAAPMVFVLTLVLWTVQALRLFDYLQLEDLADGTTAATITGSTPGRSPGLIILQVALALAFAVWLVVLLRSGWRPSAAAFTPRGVRWRRVGTLAAVYVAVLVWASVALGASGRSERADRIITLLLFVLVLGIPIAIVLAFRYLLRRIPGGYRTAFALLAMLAAYVALAAELRHNDDLIGGHFFLVSSAVALAVVLGVWSGLFAILGWAGRAGLREAQTITSIAGRIIPVFMLIVVFGLFAADPWQVTLKLRGSRLAETIGLIMLIALFTALGAARGELAYSRRDAGEGGHDAPLGRLSRAQTVNTYVKIAGTQLIQGLLFLVLVSAILLVLVTVAIPDETVRTWIGQPPTPLRFLGVTTGFTRNAFDTSVFMAAFAMLSFLVAAATDPQYRTELFDPMVEEIRTTIAEVDPTSASRV